MVSMMFSGLMAVRIPVEQHAAQVEDDGCFHDGNWEIVEKGWF
jgi:hypothetical protein